MIMLSLSVFYPSHCSVPLISDQFRPLIDDVFCARLGSDTLTPCLLARDGAGGRTIQVLDIVLVASLAPRRSIVIPAQSRVIFSRGLFLA